MQGKFIDEAGSSLPQFIAFIRGVNVGGNKKLSMGELKSSLVGAGYSDVLTLINSGNVVVSTELEQAIDVEENLTEHLLSHHSLNVDVFVRTLAQLESIVTENPFIQEAASDPSHLLVVFQRTVPSLAQVTEFQSAMIGPERVGLAAGHLLVYYPVGIGESQIAKTPGYKVVAGSGSARNWNTVLKLIETASRVGLVS
ncbi:DUF1697 domain-containing protein [soil metagenome]